MRDHNWIDLTIATANGDSLSMTNINNIDETTVKQFGNLVSTQLLN